jgi:hypothetical protein
VAVKNAAQGTAAKYIIGGMMEDGNMLMTNTQEDPLNTISMGWGATNSMLTDSMLTNDMLTTILLEDLTEDLKADPTADLTNGQCSCG